MLRSRVLILGSCVAIVAFALLVYSIASTSVLRIEPTDLGLASQLPLTYWIGFSLLFCLWYIGKNSRYLLVIALVLTVSYLYVAPAVIRATPWISNSYYPFGEALLINSTGHLVLHPSAVIVSYLDWPFFLYLASAFTLVTGIPHEILLKYFPLLIISLVGLFSVLILRSKLKFSLSLFGAAWILGSLFIRQQYFGPQAVAYVFFLLMLLLASWLFFEERPNKRILAALLLFLGIVTTFTHPLTSLMSVLSIFALYFTYRFVLGKASEIISALCLLLGATWLGYNMLAASGFFRATVMHLSEILFGEREIAIYNEPSRIVGSPAMKLNVTSSWIIVGLSVAISVISILFFIKNTRKKTITSQEGFYVFMASMIVLFGAFAFAGEYGAHEAFQRAFMFALVPISFLCVVLLAKRPKLLVVCLIGLLLLNIPAQYGGDTYRMAAKTHLAGSAFVADYSDNSISLVGKFSLYIRYYDPLKEIEVLSSGLSFPYTTYNASKVDEAFKEALKEADYILSSDLQDNYYVYFLGFDPLEQVDFEDKCNLIYDNGRFRLFKPSSETIKP